MIKNISHISLFTKNFKKVKKFYVKLLGMKIVHEFKNNQGKTYGIFIFVGKGTFLEFFQTKKNLKINNILNHICFTVSNINKIKKKLFNYDKKIIIKRGRTDNVIQFFTKDLENNTVEFHQYDKKSKFFYLTK